ncbi:hypothetical protein D5086_026168 [Populus alba]|uniref:Uncharacterized protein n=1 Tax=Populus alba TaxID=43335 RepID=A0ACC4B155_POPAL
MATAGAKGEGSASATYARAVKTGVPRAHGGRSNRALIQIPFVFTPGTAGLGRAHEKQREVPCMAKSRIPGASHSCSVSLII